jgi:hypothetical protein
MAGVIGARGSRGRAWSAPGARVPPVDGVGWGGGATAAAGAAGGVGLTPAGWVAGAAATWVPGGAGAAAIGVGLLPPAGPV